MAALAVRQQKAVDGISRQVGVGRAHEQSDLVGVFQQPVQGRLFERRVAAEAEDGAHCEQDAQHADYRASNQKLDNMLRERAGDKAPRDTKSFEMTFDRLIASLYMTAMMQLGLMRQQGGQPQVDIIGARQTIDTLSLIAEKTKGNLTPAEENFLQNSLYELRMAYVEVTNALARPPQAGPATGTSGR